MDLYLTRLDPFEPLPDEAKEKGLSLADQESGNLAKLAGKTIKASKEQAEGNGDHPPVLEALDEVEALDVSLTLTLTLARLGGSG